MAPANQPHFTIRPASGEDINFIYATMLKSLKADSDFGIQTRKSVFFNEYEWILDDLLKASETKVLVACDPTNDEVIYSYLIHDSNTLHYVFTKEAFRLLGIAKALFIESGLASKVSDIANETVQYTHKTNSVRNWPILKLLDYNPFKLYKKSNQLGLVEEEACG